MALLQLHVKMQQGPGTEMAYTVTEALPQPKWRIFLTKHTTSPKTLTAWGICSRRQGPTNNYVILLDTRNGTSRFEIKELGRIPNFGNHKCIGSILENQASEHPSIRASERLAMTISCSQKDMEVSICQSHDDDQHSEKQTYMVKQLRLRPYLRWSWDGKKVRLIGKGW